MCVYTFQVKVRRREADALFCDLSYGAQSMPMQFQLQTGIQFQACNPPMESLVCQHQSQLEKVLRSALRGNIREGKEINCVFIEDFPFLEEAAFTQYIRMDRRHGDLHIAAYEEPLNPGARIYADGSYLQDKQRAGYGGFVTLASGERQVYQQSFEGGASNLMELLAVQKGLELLQDEEQIQINTDSRFVIRGLIQWVHFWRHNQWQTAYGTPVKYVEDWQASDALCAGKEIEFRWIKGHSGHAQQDFCHRLAKEAGQNNF